MLLKAPTLRGCLRSRCPDVRHAGCCAGMWGRPLPCCRGFCFCAGCPASPRLQPPPQCWIALTRCRAGEPACWVSCPLSLSSALTVVLKSPRSHLPVVLRARFPCGCVCSCFSLFLAALQGMQTQAASILFGSPSPVLGALEHISYASDLKIPFMCLRLSGFYFLMLCL